MPPFKPEEVQRSGEEGEDSPGGVDQRRSRESQDTEEEVIGYQDTSGGIVSIINKMEETSLSPEKKFKVIKAYITRRVSYFSDLKYRWLSLFDIIEIYAFLAGLGGPPMASIRKVLRSGGTPLLKLKNDEFVLSKLGPTY